MADLATAEFLNHLESLYPATSTPPGSISPWAFVAATAFSASNVPEAVPLVLKSALERAPAETRRLLVRRIKDSIFKSGMLSGYPKAINALGQLHSAVPEELRDKEPLRDMNMGLGEAERIGQDLFASTYGETTANVQGHLYEIYPDLERFCTILAYGYVYGYNGVLTPAETSFTMIAALIASDVPRQIKWHLDGAMRNGASREEVRAVRQIAIEVAQKAGVAWKHEIPDI